MRVCPSFIFFSLVTCIFLRLYVCIVDISTVPIMKVGTLPVNRACSVPQASPPVTGYRGVVQLVKTSGWRVFVVRMVT